MVGDTCGAALRSNDYWSRWGWRGASRCQQRRTQSWKPPRSQLRSRFGRRVRGPVSVLNVRKDQPLSSLNQYDAGLAPVDSHVVLGLDKRCGSLSAPLRPIVRRRPPCVWETFGVYVIWFPHSGCMQCCVCVCVCRCRGWLCGSAFINLSLRGDQAA